MTYKRKLIKYADGGDLPLDPTIEDPQNPKKVGGLYDVNKRAYVDSVLNANKNLNWVQRLTQKNTPHIQVPGEPYPSTHLMRDNGKGYVYPSVVNQNGHLVYLPTEDQAETYARNTNTGIQLPQQQGTWFAGNGYKQGTGVLKEFGNGGEMIHKRKFAYGGRDYSTPNSFDTIQLDAQGFPIKPTQTPQANPIGGYAQAADFAGNLLQNIAPNSTAANIGGSALSLGAKGAMAGSAFGPAGTLVGGAVGAVTGVIGGILGKKQKDEAYRQKVEAENRVRQQRQAANEQSVLSQYNVEGNDIGGGFYKNGGFLRPQHNTAVYKGYRSMANPHYYPKMALGGVPPTGDPTLNVTAGGGWPAPGSAYWKQHPLTTEHKDGSIRLWGEDPTNDMSVQQLLMQHQLMQAPIPNQPIAPVTPSNMALGYDNTYTPSRDRQLNNNIPILKSPTGRRYAKGGLLKYVNGGVPLASDTQKFVGPSHANGGIPIDANGDGQADAEVEGNEVQKDDQIYSDRLNPSPQLLQLLKDNKISANGTYADVATKLGKMKGKYEVKVASYSPVARRTGKAMGDRIENLMQATFADQEITKPQEPQQQMFADGGELGGPDDPRITAYNNYLYQKQMTKRRGEQGVRDWNPATNSWVNIPTPQLPNGYEEYTTRDGDLKLRPVGTTPYDVPVTPTAATSPAYNIINGDNINNPGKLFNAPNYFPNLSTPTGMPIGMSGSSGSFDAPTLPVKATPPINNPNVVPPIVRSTTAGRRSPSPYTGRGPFTRSAQLPSATGVGVSAPVYGTQQAVTAPEVLTVNVPASNTNSSSILDKVGDVIDNYGSDIMNVASFIGNQSSINKMKAPQFNLAPAPRYNYTDRSGLAKYENSLAGKYATKALTNTSAQGRTAQAAQIHAQQIAGNNQINQQENMRRDAYNENYNTRVLQNDYTNTDILNRQADINTQVGNEKLALSTQNRNTLNQGIIANDASRRAEDLDRQKALTILASTPDPDKALNLLTKFMNPTMAKRLQQLYKKR